MTLLFLALATRDKKTNMTSAVARKLDTIRQKAGFKNIDVANVLGTRAETVSRWSQGKAYPQGTAERNLLELEYIVDQLSEFYNPQEARLWMFSRQRLLSDESPADLIKSGHIDDVLQLIREMREAVFR